MPDFKRLAVWEKSHKLTLSIYRETALFPKMELFGLTSQIRRASASIGANLAEGSARHRDTEFGRFLLIAIGSASELENHLLLARDLGYMSAEIHFLLNKQLNEIGRMLVALHDRVRGVRFAKKEEPIGAE